MKSQAWSPLIIGAVLAGLILLFGACSPRARQNQVATPTPQQNQVATPTPQPVAYGSVAVCNTDGIGAYLRRTPGGERIVAWPEGTTMEALSVTGVDEVFFKVRDNWGNEGWVSSAYLCPPGVPPVATKPPRPSPEPSRAAPAKQMASVVRVIDGDTIDVTIAGRSERVRYYGSDAPERGQKCFSEATAYNAELVGGVVYLESDARDRDAYGRLLRYVFGEDGAPIDGLLIAEGFARAWTVDGKYRGWLMEAESQARRRGVGCLWR